MSGQPDLSRRESYRYWYQEKLRFSDTDMVGHVNNVAFAALMESGRTNFTRSGVIENLPRDVQVVVRRMELDYIAELHWPAEIDIGCRLLRLGSSSFAIGSGIFHGDTCAASAVTTLVLIDKTTRKATPIPGGVRSGMQRHVF